MLYPPPFQVTTCSPPQLSQGTAGGPFPIPVVGMLCAAGVFVAEVWSCGRFLLMSGIVPGNNEESLGGTCICCCCSNGGGGLVRYLAETNKVNID